MRYQFTAALLMAASLAAATTNPVQITLAIDKHSYYFTEPIYTTYTIVNVTTSTLLLPVGFVEYPYGNPPLEIFAERSRQRVNSLRRVVRDDWGLDIFQRSVVLEPGHPFSRSLDLLSIYYPDHNVGGPRLDTTDVYRLTFVYQNPVQVRGTTYTALVGEHRSNSVVFRLRPPAGPEHAAAIRDLRSSEPNKLRRALDALSMTKDPAVLPHLLRITEAARHPLREVACSNLRYFNTSSSALGRLTSIVTSDPDEKMRSWAAEALAEIGDPIAIPALAELCAQDERFPRAAITAARILLNQFKSVEYLDRIEGVMKRHMSPPSPQWERRIEELRKKNAK